MDVSGASDRSFERHQRLEGRRDTPRVDRLDERLVIAGGLLRVGERELPERRVEPLAVAEVIGDRGRLAVAWARGGRDAAGHRVACHRASSATRAPDSFVLRSWRM
jgi:hypothetical protein